jgi:hypothetical protein
MANTLTTRPPRLTSLDPRFVGSNPHEDDGILRAIKNIAQFPSKA